MLVRALGVRIRLESPWCASGRAPPEETFNCLSHQCDMAWEHERQAQHVAGNAKLVVQVKLASTTRTTSSGVLWLAVAGSPARRVPGWCLARRYPRMAMGPGAAIV